VRARRLCAAAGGRCGVPELCLEGAAARWLREAAWARMGPIWAARARFGLDLAGAEEWGRRRHEEASAWWLGVRLQEVARAACGAASSRWWRCAAAPWLSREVLQEHDVVARRGRSASPATGSRRRRGCRGGGPGCEHSLAVSATLDVLLAGSNAA
jgi:hypothetical protein